MAKPRTGLWSNLRILYGNYGGWGSLFSSSYFLISAALSLLCWRAVFNESWIDTAKIILPPLAGFSVAAYALFFAILDERARSALRSPSDDLGGRSPLLMLASSISHAVIIQVFGIIVAIVFSQKPFPYVKNLELYGSYINWFVSAVGLIVTIYGIVLVVASVLSIFRVLQIQAKL